jgi:hypothetical protein
VCASGGLLIFWALGGLRLDSDALDSDAVEGDLQAVVTVFEGAVLDGDGRSFDLGMDDRFSDLRKSDVAGGGVGKGSNDLLVDPDGDPGCHGGDSNWCVWFRKLFNCLGVASYKTGFNNPFRFLRAANYKTGIAFV